MLDIIDGSKGLFDYLHNHGSGTVSRVGIINGKRKGLVLIMEQDIDRICVTPYKNGVEARACFDDFFEWQSGQVQEPPLIPRYYAYKHGITIDQNPRCFTPA